LNLASFRKQLIMIAVSLFTLKPYFSIQLAKFFLKRVPCFKHTIPQILYKYAETIEKDNLCQIIVVCILKFILRPTL